MGSRIQKCKLALAGGAAALGCNSRRVIQLVRRGGLQDLQASPNSIAQGQTASHMTMSGAGENDARINAKVETDVAKSHRLLAQNRVQIKVLISIHARAHGSTAAVLTERKRRAPIASSRQCSNARIQTRTTLLDVRKR